MLTLSPLKRIAIAANNIEGWFHDHSKRELTLTAERLHDWKGRLPRAPLALSRSQASCIISRSPNLKFETVRG